MKHLLEILNKLPFKNDIFSLGGELYACGGIVRDVFLNKKSKDLDILVTKIQVNDLISILKKYGKTSVEGESFPVIKFTEFGSTNITDISIPRKEKHNGEKGHKAFDVIADPFLPLDIELSRRDIKINSILVNSNGDIYDPFGGLDDINNKVISMTNPNTFFDDPLRSLRCVGFASRFDFRIEENTLKLIKHNSHKINDISSERIFEEFEKIINKGNPSIGIKLLMETELYDKIFKHHFNGDLERFEKVQTLGEFLFLIFDGIASSKFKTIFPNGNNKIYNEIKALELLKDANNTLYIDRKRNLMFDAFKICPIVIRTKVFQHLNKYLDEFDNGTYPKSLSDLAVDGDDLLSLDYEGVQIGIKFKEIVSAIFKDKITNNRKEIFQFLLNN